MKIVRYKGFTLIELMIAVLVVAILLAIAAPAFINLVKDNRMLSEVYAMRAALNNARSKALSERSFVTFCRRNDDGSACGDPDTVAWNAGYIAFVDADGDGVNDPNDTIIVEERNEEASLDVAYDEDLVRFDSQGYARGFNGTFTLCDDRGNEKARGLIVSPVGSVRAAVVDPNDIPGSDSLANCP